MTFQTIRESLVQACTMGIAMAFLALRYEPVFVVALRTGQIAVLGMVIPQVLIFGGMAGAAYLARRGNRIFLDLECAVR